MNKYLAEAFGTFWLVLGGCGSAVLAAVAQCWLQVSQTWVLVCWALLWPLV